jgi:hypothetical protein
VKEKTERKKGIEHAAVNQNVKSLIFIKIEYFPSFSLPGYATKTSIDTLNRASNSTSK